MSDLVQWVQGYQSAGSREERDELAGRIASAVVGDLWLFLRARFPESASAGPEDVMQEVLVAITLGLDECRADSNERFWSWVYTIARRKMAGRFRKRGIELVSVADREEHESWIDSIAASSPEVVGSRVDLDYAMKLLEKSSPPCRELLWMRYIMGADYETIASSLGIHYDAVRMRILRCRSLARDLIEKGA